MNQAFQLTIETTSGRKTIAVPPERARRRLTDILRTAKLPLNTRCGQRGLCDGCLVQLRAGALLDLDRGTLVASRSQPKMLRACRLEIPETGNATVHIPVRSLLAHQPQVVTSFRINVPCAQAPVCRVLNVDLKRWDRTGDVAGQLRSWAAIQLDTTLPVEVSAELAAAVAREDNETLDCIAEYRGDAWYMKCWHAPRPAFGVAIDVGTTTVVVALVELATGRVVGDASALNAQARLGDNVLTRINACMTKPELVARFQKAVVRETINPLLQQVVDDAALETEQLVCVVAAGNSTMLHLLAGVDPSSMGTAPFTPTFLEHRVESSEQLGFEIGEHVHADSRASDDLPQGGNCAVGVHDWRGRPVHFLPGAAAYIGADITAGVLATGMAYDEKTTLLVDLGTNGEIVLKHGQTLVGCATAAGPAFEGAGLTHGMRAGRGAIAHIWLDTAPPAARIETIADGAPLGLCGTAYVDVLARGRQAGILGPTGRFVAGELDGLLLEHPTHGRALAVARDADGERLLVTEADIASLLQAKAAIAAGILCLLRRMELDAADIDKVYLAGGFGFHMHVDSLIGCGMLPGFEPDQVEMVGNTALAGAYLALLDVGALDELKMLSRRMDIVELNLDPEFEGTYIDQLILP